MKAKLIEYDYTYQDFDACRGMREKKASNRAILFFNNKNQAVAMAIPEDGKIKIQQAQLCNRRIYLPVLSNRYTILQYKAAPFKRYRIIKSLTFSLEHFNLIMHAATCYMKIEDLKNTLLELIRAESKDFAYRI